jgi:hypothetical protein
LQARDALSPSLERGSYMYGLVLSNVTSVLVWQLGGDF